MNDHTQRKMERTYAVEFGAVMIATVLLGYAVLVVAWPAAGQPKAAGPLLVFAVLGSMYTGLMKVQVRDERRRHRTGG